MLYLLILRIVEEVQPVDRIRCMVTHRDACIAVLTIIHMIEIAVLRSVLFVIFFTFVNAFLSIDSLTWYVALFVLAALLVIGLVDLLIEPAKNRK